jgi:hypothetical protein
MFHDIEDEIKWSSLMDRYNATIAPDITDILGDSCCICIISYTCYMRNWHLQYVINWGTFLTTVVYLNSWYNKVWYVNSPLYFNDLSLILSSVTYFMQVHALCILCILCIIPPVYFEWSTFGLKIWLF